MRWDDIKRTYRRNVQLRGVGEDEKFGQMIVQLSGFSEGLNAIRRALDSGLDRVLQAEAAKAEGDGTTLKATFDEQSLAAVKCWIDELKSAYTETARAAAAGEQPQEIRVISKVPTSILNVLKHQFKLMAGWLQPILLQAQKQDREMGELKQLLDDNLASYKSLIAELEEAARRGDHLYDRLAEHKARADAAGQAKKK
jgi:hypothetical protein